MAYSLAYTKINGFAVIYHLSTLKFKSLLIRKVRLVNPFALPGLVFQS